MKFTSLSITTPHNVVAIKGVSVNYGDGIFIRDTSRKVYHMGPRGLNHCSGAVWERILMRHDVTLIYEGDTYQVEF